MITCRRLAELPLEYLEKELAAEPTEEVRRHLDVCPRFSWPTSAIW